jgi:two-component system chemotaxis response regulator CheB
LKALQLGAIDFVSKPSGAVDLDMSSVREELCRKLKMAAKVRVVRTATRSKLPQPESESPSPEVLSAKNRNGARGAGRFPMVVVASSTGGPATLMKFAPLFPADFPGAVVLVQHMPGNFTTQFSNQLAEVSRMKVKEAEAGEIIVPGQIYVCPGTHHMKISATGRIVLDDGPRISGYRPCADLLFESAAAYSGANTIGVVLTGMGNDGSKGVKSIKAAGGFNIAQDESTAVIFGMPQEAIKTGAIDVIHPADEIFGAIEKRVLQIFSAARVGS